MKWTRLAALSALLLSFIAALTLFLMVKYVPYHEDAWQRTRSEITPAKRALLGCSHLCQRFFIVLLPGCVGLVAISATGYVWAAKKDKPSQTTTPELGTQWP